MNVPKLRFPGFEGEWEEKTIRDVAQIMYGKDQKEVVSENGKYPILGTGGEIGKTDKYLYNKPSVLIGRKGTIDKPRYMDSPFWTVDTLFYTEILTNTNPKWLYYKFETINWYLYNEASGVPSLSGSTIYKIKLRQPDIPEQTKIASFLSAVDEKLQALKKKKELLQQYKQGVMQKIFAQEIRFKDDEGNEFGEWEEKKLVEIADKISDGYHGTPTYDISGGYYFINGNNLINNQITINENTKKVNEQQYQIHKSNLTNNTILLSINGTIGSLAFYNLENVVLGKSVCYINLKKGINKHFVFHQLKSEKIRNLFSSELTGTTIKNLSLATIKETIINFPVIQEQIKIANFLSAIDDKINHCQTQIAATEQFKKALLQQMFC